MTSLPQLIGQFRRHTLRRQKTQDKDKGKQKPSDPPGDSPTLRPAPLVSPTSPTQKTTPSTLPHLVDLNVDEPSVVRHQHDTLFWNSTLEERGTEAVPESDALGKVGDAGRTYWVKDSPQDFPALARQEGPREVAAQDFGRESQRDGSAEQEEWDDDNADLYAPPTPPPKWPRRMDSLGAKAQEVRNASGGERQHAELKVGKSRIMRGGAKPTVPFDLKLSPAVLEHIEAAARADPLRDGVLLREAYVARPSVVHGEGGGEKVREDLEEARRSARDVENEDEVRRDEEEDSLNEYLLLGWDPNAPRPSTAELENAYGRYEDEERSLNSGGDEKEWVGREATSDISQHPAFRNLASVQDEGSSEEEETQPIRAHEPTNLETSENANPTPPLVNGIPPDPSLETSIHANHPPSERTHSPSSVPSYLLRSYQSHLSGLATDTELDDYLLSNDLLDPNSETTLPTYQRTLATQAKSIRDLHARIDDLTLLNEYYEDTLLPQAFTFWNTTTRENCVLTAAVRSTEQENALLWDLLMLSRKLLNLCWERDRAVVDTVNEMRTRKMHRANCTLLERLVGKGGPGRGGDEERKKGRGWGRLRVESPFREDLEQLGFVCGQNLRVLAEDLDDWEVEVGAAMDGREERVQREGGGSKREGEGEEEENGS